jgi:hypothetical protein
MQALTILPALPEYSIDPGYEIKTFQKGFCELIGIPENIPIALAIVKRFSQ